MTWFKGVTANGPVLHKGGRVELKEGGARFQGALNTLTGHLDLICYSIF